MNLKYISLMIIIASVSTVSVADVYVNGYTKKDGTYVQGHYRSDPNSTASDNWSTKGNVNPYTGQEGTKNINDPYNTNTKSTTGSFDNSETRQQKGSFQDDMQNNSKSTKSILGN